MDFQLIFNGCSMNIVGVFNGSSKFFGMICEGFCFDCQLVWKDLPRVLLGFTLEFGLSLN